MINMLFSESAPHVSSTRPRKKDQCIRGTVVVRWTAGQQVDRSILCQGHDSPHPPRLFPSQYSLTVQNRGLRRHSFIHPRKKGKWHFIKGEHHQSFIKTQQQHIFCRAVSVSPVLINWGFFLQKFCHSWKSSSIVDYRIT